MAFIYIVADSEFDKEVVSLLAYDVPLNSPVAAYLGQKQRETVADFVNGALLGVFIPAILIVFY